MSTMMATAQVLAFLGTAAMVLAACVGALVFAMLGRRFWARRAAILGVAAATAYTLALVGFGLVSPSVVLPQGARKAFCEIDCHVVYEITGGGHRGDTIMVTVRELFDPESIASRRGNAPLHPGSRQFALIDETGTRWRPVNVRSTGTAPLFAQLRPGQSHQAMLSFALPGGVGIRGLLVEDDGPLSRLLIGHERSPFHEKTLLALPSDLMRARGALSLSGRVRPE